MLRQKGRFVEALAELERGYKLDSRKPGWTYPSEEFIGQVKHLIKLDAKLPQILNAQIKPAEGNELIDLAMLCRYKQHYAASTRLFNEAFAAQRPPADGLLERNRYNAACAAALAGCGQGKDAANLEPTEYARLRGQALAWLRADLKSQAARVDKAPGSGGALLSKTMREWQQDPDLAGIRDAAALAKLPEADRQEWQQLWADVADTLKRSQGRAATKKRKPDTT